MNPRIHNTAVKIRFGRPILGAEMSPRVATWHAEACATSGTFDMEEIPGPTFWRGLLVLGLLFGLFLFFVVVLFLPVINLERRHIAAGTLQIMLHPTQGS